MKKSILAVLLFVSASTYAQNLQDTIPSDTTVYTKGAILIKPVIVNANGDSAFSFVWSVFGLDNSGNGCNSYVSLRNKQNKKIAEFNCPIPASVVSVWGLDNTVIDNYILEQNPRLQKL